MKKIWYSVILFGFFSLFSGIASAISLDEAKAQGLVGERADGYLGVVSSTSTEIQQLIDSINQKRKAKYIEIAARNGTDLATVEKLAGEKTVSKTPSGQYVNVNGSWQRK